MAIRRRTVSAPRPPAEYTPEYAANDALRITESRGLSLKPVDVLGLAYSIGIQVEYLPLPEGTSGFLRRSGGNWIIGVNSMHHPNRQRFTIAHELGHYFLHRDHGDFVDKALFRKELQSDRREFEANSFASRLLMPADDFENASRRLNADFDLVAKQFGVSSAAARFRAETLGQEHIFG